MRLMKQIRYKDTIAGWCGISVQLLTRAAFGTSLTIPILAVGRLHLDRMVHSAQNLYVVQVGLRADGILPMVVGDEAAACNIHKWSTSVAYDLISKKAASIGHPN